MHRYTFVIEHNIEGSLVMLSVVLRPVLYTLMFLSTSALAGEGRCYYGIRSERYTREFDSSYTCEGFLNDEDLSEAAAPTEGDVRRAFVVDVHLNYLRSDTFQNRKFRNVESLAVTHSTLGGITDTDVALRGLEKSLKELTFDRCTFLHSLDWNALRNLRNLSEIFIWSSSMSAVEGVQELSSAEMRLVWIVESGLTYLPDGAFAGLPNLRLLYLYENQISELTRSMLPNPADKLERIDLSQNQLKNLPNDIFTNMPALNNIDVSGNGLMVLDEKTFEPVWKRLDYFYADGNPLKCDCRLSWILNSKFPQHIDFKCRHPEKLKGKDVGSLKRKDLYCL